MGYYIIKKSICIYLLLCLIHETSSVQVNFGLVLLFVIWFAFGIHGSGALGK